MAGQAWTTVRPADHNQILLSQRASAVVGDSFEAEPVGELSIKGLSRPVVAVNVVAARPI